MRKGKWNDLWKWKGNQGQGETEALIPNMMYMSRNREPKPIHIKRERKGKDLATAKVARSCPMARSDRATLLPTKTVKGRVVHGWGPLWSNSVLDDFGEWEMMKRSV